MHFNNLLNACSTLFFYFCWGSERKKIEKGHKQERFCRETRETHDLQDLFGIIRNIFYRTVKCQPLHRKTFSQPSRSFEEEDCCWSSSLGSVSVHHMVLMVLQETLWTYVLVAAAYCSPGWITVLSSLCGGVLYTGKGRKFFHPTSFRKVEMTDPFNFVYTIENIRLNTSGTFRERIRMEQYDWINIKFKELPDFFLSSL